LPDWIARLLDCQIAQIARLLLDCWIAHAKKAGAPEKKEAHLQKPLENGKVGGAKKKEKTHISNIIVLYLLVLIHPFS
jgi:hypothetical protein